MSLQNLPPFTGSIVKVSLINGGFIEVPTRMFTETLIPGHDSLPAPSHSFLVENETLGKKVLYDLGIMKAWKDKLPSSRTYAPIITMIAFLYLCFSDRVC